MIFNLTYIKMSGYKKTGQLTGFFNESNEVYPFLEAFAQLSFKVTVRLNTSCASFE